MLKLNHKLLTLIFFITACVSLYFYRDSFTTLADNEIQIESLNQKADSILKINDNLLSVIDFKEVQKDTLYARIDSLNNEIDKSYKRIFDTTLEQDSLESYWYVSYKTLSGGTEGFEGVKTRTSFFDPVEIRKEIKIENKIDNDEIVYILFVQQMSEAAYQHYLLIEPYNK